MCPRARTYALRFSVWLFYFLRTITSARASAWCLFSRSLWMMCYASHGPLLLVDPWCFGSRLIDANIGDTEALALAEMLKTNTTLESLKYRSARNCDLFSLCLGVGVPLSISWPVFFVLMYALVCKPVNAAYRRTIYQMTALAVSQQLCRKIRACGLSSTLLQPLSVLCTVFRVLFPPCHGVPRSVAWPLILSCC